MNELPSKRLFIKTFGCQMNVYDSERMTDLLTPLGYRLTDNPAEADLAVLNTCHIRDKAAEKVYSELGRLRRFKDDRNQAGESMVIAVAGCVAQAEGMEIQRRQPAVDLILGPQAYHRLPELIARVHRATGRLVAADFEAEAKFDALPQVRNVKGVTAFVTVQEGCDRFCTFCVVPYTRGAEFSRSADAIEGEVRALAARGVREITLLGQNVNAWRGAGADGLAGLVRRLARVEGVERLRYTTSHPADMSEDLIAAHAEVEALMPYLHLPVQAGSNVILRAMNRAHTRESYLRIIERLRSVRPDIALSGDFIVGFPGETDADFEATLSLIREVSYASAFSFKYSPRPGTPAAALPRQVDEATKSARLRMLQELLNAQQAAFNGAAVGRVLPVLVERPGREPGQMIGRSPYLQAVHFDAAADRAGSMVSVTIEAAHANSLAGRVVESA